MDPLGSTQAHPGRSMLPAWQTLRKNICPEVGGHQREGSRDLHQDAFVVIAETPGAHQSQGES